MTDAVHTEHEDHGWTIDIPDHPKRSDSPEYVATRALMNKLAREVPDLIYGKPPYQDHHGGGLWLKDDGGWFFVRNLVGMEWSSQFAADPAKVDQLRVNAARVYAAFPAAAAELGIAGLLATPVTDAAGIARWTDSICNASVPLPAGLHTGVISAHQAEGGVHHYPAPVAEIQVFKYDDFNLWVSDAEGTHAVAPVGPRGSGDKRVHVLYAHPGSALHQAHQAHRAAGTLHVLAADHELAVQAFAGQT
jgi:hypothetical protein